jgi:hypothetical protein
MLDTKNMQQRNKGAQLPHLWTKLHGIPVVPAIVFPSAAQQARYSNRLMAHRCLYLQVRWQIGHTALCLSQVSMQVL